MNASELNPPPLLLLEPLVRAALAEDLGRAGDITSAATIATDAGAKARLVTRKPGRISGLECAGMAFRLIDPALQFTPTAADGDAVNAGAVLATVEGNARSILAGERVALNFLGHLSGVATATAALAEAMAGTGARIICTRKTIPGLRLLQKYAVRCGGGLNHRFGLDDAVLVKDNHIVAAGGIAPALARLRQGLGHMVKVEVEVDTLEQLREALAAGADAVLLDNMTPDMLRQAVAVNASEFGGRAMLEASGNVTLSTVRAIAETGVDRISSGAITHSAPSLDIGLDF